ncbi:MAG: ABC transporter substrate-binding protein, partial [Planctomycetota bacterium]
MNDATPDPVLKIRCPGLSKPIDTRDLSSLYDWLIAHNLVGTLIFSNKYGEPESFIARNWDYTNDCKSITFELDPGAKFSDGTSITAHDVAFT